MEAVEREGVIQLGGERHRVVLSCVTRLVVRVLLGDVNHILDNECERNGADNDEEIRGE